MLLYLCVSYCICVCVYLCVDVFVCLCICVFVLMWNLLFMEMWFCVFVVMCICVFVEMCDCLFVDLLICVFVEMWFRANFYSQQKTRRTRILPSCSSCWSLTFYYNQIVMSLVSLFHSSLTVMVMRWLWL